MDPKVLLEKVSALLWTLADDAAGSLADPLAGLQPLTGEGEPLQGRLLEPLTDLPDRQALLGLLQDMLGDVTDTGSVVRAHGWHRAPGSARGLALVLGETGSRAVLAVSPGPDGQGPTVDVVVSPGAALTRTVDGADWQVTADIRSEQTWNATYSPGSAPVAPMGTATITATRKGRLASGPENGPHVSTDGITVRLTATPGAAVEAALGVKDFQVAVLPAALATFLGDGGGTATEKTDIEIYASRVDGLRFKEGGLRLQRPVSMSLPGVTTRRFVVDLDHDESGLVLRPSISALAKPPVLPLSASLDGLGLQVPVSLLPDRIGIDPTLLDAAFPTGMGIGLELGAVGGSGAITERGTPGGGAYAGVLDIDLGIVKVQAFGLLQLPVDGRQLSFLVLLGAEFGYPGIQLGFGFALDAVGGLVGLNRRVDENRLRGLVLDGNADRILFPGNAVARADEIAGSLEACFPVARDRFVVGPMVRITWGGRIVSLSAAVVMDLPEPVRALLVGRLLIAVPDPVVPLIRLQANVFGKIDPAVPSVELLATLTGSWIVGTPISGECYLLFRGGRDAAFVLSAGGFHPRYVRPPGVPALRRLSMELGSPVLRLRAEAYLALTSNSLQFGAQLSLDATIAECGVEGHLGLDALFVWEPTLSFAVHVYASVAVLAFGERLASVGLDFTLEGPAPWHAFGTGSISILFWDVSLDFDESWGDARAVASSVEDVLPLLRQALERPDAWTAERPVAQRSGLRFTDEANTALAKGDVAQPDATFRLSQRIVPLETTVHRFHRVGVPAQKWQLTPVDRMSGAPLSTFGPVTERFVPGEFFALTDEQQLTSNAFEDLPSGVRLAGDDVRPGERHLVDDSYETGYKVEAGWFTSFSEPDNGKRLPGTGAFTLESFARPVGAAERADRWRAAQRPIGTTRVEIRT
ncbi:DUF6603 domain-containing protein [Streptomyces virginiae]|uniref:DUF6603 domain-containing protein n=1 Tax=Streptomyces virginiae TaxID=1961 RepID=UPI00225A467E|nr:DUF6603 domain-containing protein [Streptomyces virginiae]MCX5181014.1 hypothetical protein [Streptomyces virginiae]